MKATILIFHPFQLLNPGSVLTSCWSKHLSGCFVGLESETEPSSRLFHFASPRCSSHGVRAHRTFRDEVLINHWTSPFGSGGTPAGLSVCHVLFGFRQHSGLWHLELSFLLLNCTANNGCAGALLPFWTKQTATLQWSRKAHSFSDPQGSLNCSTCDLDLTFASPNCG